MTEVNHKPTTMRDIAHGSASTVSGGADLGNVEILLHELVRAVKGVSLSVTVPPLAPPDVNVTVSPIPLVLQEALSAALEPRVPTEHQRVVLNQAVPPVVQVVVPRQWALACVIFTLLAADMALRLVEILKP